MSNVATIHNFDERKYDINTEIYASPSRKVTRESKYRPWESINDRAINIEDCIRHGHPIFNHMPKVGDWFQGRAKGNKVRITRAVQRRDDIFIECTDLRSGSRQEFTLSYFLYNFIRVASLLSADYICVEYGFTPAEVLAACNARKNKYYRIALAVESAFGKWRGVFKKLNIEAPKDGVYGNCPLCGSQSYHSLNDFNNGMCRCYFCGEHSGLELIANYKNISLVSAADITLSLLPLKLRRSVENRINTSVS